MRTMIILLTFMICSVSWAEGKVNFDLEKTEFTWSAYKKVGKGHTGKIKLKSASGEIKKGMISKATFVMDMKSFTVTDLDGEWKTKFLNHVKSGDFFEVEKHPTATLELGPQKKAGEVAGKLTIKGKTHPVKVVFKEKGGVYSGKFTFNRTKWGVTYGSENFFKVAADKIIKDDVDLEFKVATKKPAAPAKKKK